MKWLWLSLATLMAFVLSTCSVVVDPSSLVIRCEIPIGGTEDPCLGAGMHCVASECKPCEGETETCNGFDDDCDGVVDNGHDTDGDGFTWCGGGRAEYADCAPNDPAIHPAGPVGPDNSSRPGTMFVAAPDEICDAKDNDCDSKVDEGEDCKPPENQSCVMVGCPENQRCDATTGVCADRLPTGSGCQTDAECAGGFCIRKGSFDLGVELADNRCATACCSDVDCAAGSLCVASDVGVRVCLPSNIAVRGANGEAARCTRNADCASGSCVSGRCATRCTADAVCKDATCGLTNEVSEARRWLCGEPRGREDAGTSCSALDLSACRSGFCRENVCTQACGRNGDCEADETCSYAAVRALLGPTTVVPLCVPRTEVTSGTLCCTNKDCGVGQLCAPYAVTESGQWTMVCR